MSPDKIALILNAPYYMTHETKHFIYFYLGQQWYSSLSQGIKGQLLHSSQRQSLETSTSVMPYDCVYEVVAYSSSKVHSLNVNLHRDKRTCTNVEQSRVVMTHSAFTSSVSPYGFTQLRQICVKTIQIVSYQHYTNVHLYHKTVNFLFRV